MSISNEDIAKYYNTHQIIYNIFWSKIALHYGFWYKGTKNLCEAILNTDKFVVDILDIHKSDTVLDAGCGVGGTSMYIAKTIGARVYGVTLSDAQIEIARKMASKSAGTSLLNFTKQDFTKTNFQEETFSKIFGIESICHAHKKIDFLNEAYRIMKPGGKIAVVDGFLIKENLTDKEKKIYTKFIEGWRVSNLSTKKEFLEYLQKAGFKNIVFHDKLDRVKRSSRRLYLYGLMTYPIEFIKLKLGIGTPNFSCFYQKRFLDGSIGTYGVFVASKL